MEQYINRTPPINIQQYLYDESNMQRALHLGHTHAIQSRQSSNDAHHYSKKVVMDQGLHEITKKREEKRIEIVQVYLLSQHAVRHEVTLGEIQWDITKLRGNSDVKDCVEIRILPFEIPFAYNSIPGAHEYYTNNRIYLEIVELPVFQGINCSSFDRFHFELDILRVSSTPQPDTVTLAPISSRTHFKVPQTTLSSLTVRFFMQNPYPPFNFQRVRMYLPVVEIALVLVPTIGNPGGAPYTGTNPAQFRLIGATTTDIMNTDPLITPRIPVYTNTLNSTNAAFDSLVNGSTSLFITRVIDPTTVELSTLVKTSVDPAPIVYTLTPLDSSGISLPTFAPFPTPAKLYIPKNRIAINFQFTTLNSSATNRLTPVYI